MTVVVRRQDRPDMRQSILLMLGRIHQMTDVLATRSMMGRRRPKPGITALKAVFKSN